MSGKSRFKRRRVFLACAAILAIGSLLTILYRQQEQRWMLMRAIEDSGGSYLTTPDGPSWFPANRIPMRLGTDDDLEYLFLASTEVDDAWLARLKGRGSIKQILLQDTDVTDAGLKHLEGLKKLERLRLDNTLVTDDGLEHLQSLKLLRRMYLKGTDVTDAGVMRLQSALPNCQIKR